jgi:hypothetical protein
VYNSQEKVAKNFSQVMSDAMRKSIREARANEIGVQLQDQERLTLQQRVGDPTFGSATSVDLQAKTKEVTQRKCLDLPEPQQEACLAAARDMLPGPSRRAEYLLLSLFDGGMSCAALVLADWASLERSRTDRRWYPSSLRCNGE